MRFRTIAIHPFVILFFCSLIVSACGTKNKGFNGLNQGGAGFNAPAGSMQDFTVNVGDRVFFDLDSSAVREDARQILASQAQWLNRYRQYAIIIEGHADERGTREYNLALGQRRAVSVRDYLVSSGVASHRLKTVSYGKERPVAVCDDISCWSRNRRAVTVIKAGGTH